MDWFSKRFVQASLLWLGAGVTLGVAMAVFPRLVLYRPAHMHMNLLGFVAMMIFGVAYHVLPRFASRPLHSRVIAGVHWWVQNAGLSMMVAGFGIVPHGVPGARMVLGTGAALSALGAYLFIYNLLRTFASDGKVRVQEPPVALRKASLAAERVAGA